MYYKEERRILSPVIKWLLIANFLFFGLQFIRGDFLRYWLALWPNAEAMTVRVSPWETLELNAFYPWQLITYAFLHDTHSISHILFNMLALWMFGQSVEGVLGTQRFTIYYFVCVIGAAVIHMMYANMVGSPVPVIGASGGVFGLLLAYGMMFPREKVLMLFFPVPIEARYFVMIYGALELFNGLARPGSGVAHFAHLGGMIFGFILLLIWRKRISEERWG
ncbi:MAG: rhomboid family intramembrane serine protease [Opitutales bacterium]|nr:rhomboid family intramembrane serine protease [Opitutales bacterium]